MMGIWLRWGTFVGERYEPVSHAVLAACFASGNAGIAYGASGTRVSLPALGATTLLAFVFFLRLRIFDEVKDQETDACVNPARPLARGLISVKEARWVAFALAAAELALILVVAPAALLPWIVTLLYSLAMLAEFWTGAWLRPRLELYAITHTFVAGLFGLCVAGVVTGLPFSALPLEIWLLVPVNWAVFNIFEFSRKTFAPSEERPGVPTYSNRWGSWGAAAITLTWVAVALLAATAALPRAMPRGALIGTLAFGSAALGLGISYGAAASPAMARAYRTGMIVWAAGFYAALASSTAWPT